MLAFSLHSLSKHATDPLRGLTPKDGRSVGIRHRNEDGAARFGETENCPPSAGKQCVVVVVNENEAARRHSIVEEFEPRSDRLVEVGVERYETEAAVFQSYRRRWKESLPHNARVGVWHTAQNKLNGRIREVSLEFQAVLLSF
jgi:hypothetical protein